ncbi:hypothetical protein PLIP_a3582 [Pseudoalteromonas lipolytica LMEB 39]|nr:hypothetical protein [Pseudoalteromonas lipolytica LMEB 39]
MINHAFSIANIENDAGLYCNLWLNFMRIAVYKNTNLVVAISFTLFNINK